MDKVISANIGFLPDSVEYLSLIVSTASQIPDTIGKLKKLKHLTLKIDLMWDFPASFSNLESLETLELNFKYEKKLCSSILELKSLKELIIRFSPNHFSFLSPEEKKESDDIKRNLIKLGVKITEILNEN